MPSSDDLLPASALGIQTRAAGGRACAVFASAAEMRTAMGKPSSQTYLLGFIIRIVGFAGAAYMLALPTLWIAAGVVILIGIGTMAAANYSDLGDR